MVLFAILSFLCYYSYVAIPSPARKGGEAYNVYNNIFHFCHGKCNSLLHLQMARQKVVWQLAKIKPLRAATLRGFW